EAAQTAARAARASQGQTAAGQAPSEEGQDGGVRQRLGAWTGGPKHSQPGSAGKKTGRCHPSPASRERVRKGPKGPGGDIPPLEASRTKTMYYRHRNSLQLSQR